MKKLIGVLAVMFIVAGICGIAIAGEVSTGFRSVVGSGPMSVRSNSVRSNSENARYWPTEGQYFEPLRGGPPPIVTSVDGVDGTITSYTVVRPNEYAIQKAVRDNSSSYTNVPLGRFLPYNMGGYNRVYITIYSIDPSEK